MKTQLCHWQIDFTGLLMPNCHPTGFVLTLDFYTGILFAHPPVIPLFKLPIQGPKTLLTPFGVTGNADSIYFTSQTAQHQALGSGIQWDSPSLLVPGCWDKDLFKVTLLKLQINCSPLNGHCSCNGPHDTKC